MSAAICNLAGNRHFAFAINSSLNILCKKGENVYFIVNKLRRTDQKSFFQTPQKCHSLQFQLWLLFLAQAKWERLFVRPSRVPLNFLNAHNFIMRENIRAISILALSFNHSHSFLMCFLNNSVLHSFFTTL